MGENDNKEIMESLVRVLRQYASDPKLNNQLTSLLNDASPKAKKAIEILKALWDLIKHR